MHNRHFTILSTSSLPFERIADIPGDVDVSVIPFTEIIPRQEDTLKSQIADYSAKKITVVFTSAHAVKFVAAMLTQKPDWKIYCVRNETRIAVVHSFGSDSIVQFAGNAFELSQCMIEDGVEKAVFFCGDQRMDVLPDNVRKYGIDLTELIVYDTILTPLPVDRKPDAVLFFSPTAVRSFFSVNGLSSATRIFAMGKTTAGALKEFTNEPIIVSPESDKAYVFNMAVAYAASHPRT